MNDDLCICGSKALFNNCCKPFLLLNEKCDTAEQLMRSRYCAFVLNKVDYLIFTSSEHLKTQITPQELQQSIDTFEFIKLDVLNADNSTVEFTAHMLYGNEHHQLRETSTFIKEDNQWKYDSGKITDTPVIKLARNDVCPCGSGKKYKKCHQK